MSRRAATHRFLTARRGTLVKAHRWLSFLLMAWLVLESVSGAAIVFAPEIDHALHRHRFDPTPGDVGPTRALAAARDARPDDIVSFLSTPASGATGGMYVAYLTDRAAETHAVVVDPGSAAITAADHHEPRVLTLLEELHFDLNSTSILGFAPLSVMGWMALLWLVVIGTGFYLWYWPGVQRWARAVRVRRRRGRFTFHLDLHKAIGFATVVPLTLVAVTGVNFCFPRQTRAVWNAVTFGAYQPGDDAQVTTSTPAPIPPISAADAARVVQGIDPSLRIESITTPGGSPVGTWEVSAIADHAFLGSVGGSRSIEVAVDQYSGQVLSIDDPRDSSFATTAYDDWSYQVHFGTFGGTTTRVLWVALGLAPLALAVTGTVMWLVRRGKRRRKPPAGDGDSAADVLDAGAPVSVAAGT